jgi:hypothetical protein
MDKGAFSIGPYRILVRIFHFGFKNQQESAHFKPLKFRLIIDLAFVYAVRRRNSDL